MEEAIKNCQKWQNQTAGTQQSWIKSYILEFNYNMTFFLQR